MTTTTEAARNLANAAVIGGDLNLARKAIATAVQRRPNYLLDLAMLNGHTITKAEVIPTGPMSGLSFHTEENIDGSTCVPFTCVPAFSDYTEADIKITDISGAQSIIGKKIISFSHADYCFDADTGTQKGVYQLEAEDGSVMTITVTSFGDVTPALRANIGDFYEIQCLFHNKVIAE